jgi:hypothetical protein
VSLIADEIENVSFFLVFLFLSNLFRLDLKNNPPLPKQLQEYSLDAQSLLSEIRKYYANQKKAGPLLSEINWSRKNWTDEHLVNAVSKLSQQEREAVTT